MDMDAQADPSSELFNAMGVARNKQSAALRLTYRHLMGSNRNRVDALADRDVQESQYRVYGPVLNKALSHRLALVCDSLGGTADRLGSALYLPPLLLQLACLRATGVAAAHLEALQRANVPTVVADAARTIGPALECFEWCVDRAEEARLEERNLWMEQMLCIWAKPEAKPGAPAIMVELAERVREVTLDLPRLTSLKEDKFTNLWYKGVPGVVAELVGTPTFPWPRDDEPLIAAIVSAKQARGGDDNASRTPPTESRTSSESPRPSSPSLFREVHALLTALAQESGTDVDFLADDESDIEHDKTLDTLFDGLGGLGEDDTMEDDMSVC